MENVDRVAVKTPAGFTVWYDANKVPSREELAAMDKRSEEIHRKYQKELEDLRQKQNQQTD